MEASLVPQPVVVWWALVMKDACGVGIGRAALYPITFLRASARTKLLPFHVHRRYRL